MLYEPRHSGEFVLSEASGNRSREVVNIAASAAALPAGQVLGKITVGAASATAKVGNGGNGTMGTITVGAGAKPGAYKLTIIEPASDAGNFIVEDPDGINVGSGAVAAAFSGGGLSFTLADGSNNFAAGDQFTITVAAGSGHYVAYDDEGTDGRQNACAVLYAAVPDSASAQEAVAYVRDCEVMAAALTGVDGAAKAALGALGIIVR